MRFFSFLQALSHQILLSIGQFSIIENFRILEYDWFSKPILLNSCGNKNGNKLVNLCGWLFPYVESGLKYMGGLLHIKKKKKLWEWAGIITWREEVQDMRHLLHISCLKKFTDTARKSLIDWGQKSDLEPIFSCRASLYITELFVNIDIWEEVVYSRFDYLYWLIEGWGDWCSS